MLLSPYTMGSLTPLIQTPTPCMDISIVNDAERIHVLYIVRNLFRTQVVYQYKQRLSISTPKVIWEDANCDNCSVAIAGEQVTLMWTVNGFPMRCVSDNNGTTFGLVERYTGDFPERCFKGELIGVLDGEREETEIYGDYQRRSKPFLLFGEEVGKKQGEAKAEVEQQPTKEPQKQPQLDTQKLAQLHAYHKKEVDAMTNLLAQRNDEITEVNARWQKQVAHLEAELATLRAENEQLKQNQLLE